MEGKTVLWVGETGQQSPVNFTIDTAGMGIHPNKLIVKTNRQQSQ